MIVSADIGLNSGMKRPSTQSAIITEAIYSVGGMGKMLPNAINQYNNVMIVALTFMFSSISVLSVLLGDIIITKVDPRISLTDKAGRS